MTYNWTVKTNEERTAFCVLETVTPRPYGYQGDVLYGPVDTEAEALQILEELKKRTQMQFDLIRKNIEAAHGKLNPWA